MDEATSALDSESEQAIQDSLEGIMRGRNRDCGCAPAVDLAPKMDRILVMEEGKIIEDGTHQELMQA